MKIQFHVKFTSYQRPKHYCYQCLKLQWGLVQKAVIKAFGVWGPKKFMGKEYDGVHRTTFIIDEDGVIEKVFSKVKTKDHTNQILESYN